VNVCNDNKWVHFVGVGGTAMGALASLLKKQGFKVTGSDKTIYEPMKSFLAREKILVKQTYSADNLLGKSWGISNDSPEIVVVGNVISKGHVEAEIIEKLCLAKKTIRLSLAQAMAQFAIGNAKSLVVSGTHGKSSTTTLLAWILHELVGQPGHFIGGIPLNLNSGIARGSGEYFAIEGDEYDTAYWDKVSKFLHYNPSWVICTGVEFDHADIFDSITDIEDSFLKLVALIKEGLIIVDAKSVNSLQKKSLDKLVNSASDLKIQVLRYGFDLNSEFAITDYQVVKLPWDQDAYGSKIICKHNEASSEFYLPNIGKHNALNFVAVLALLKKLKIEFSNSQLQKILQEYKGLKRRQEILFSDRNLVVIDDFAHHPTAIKETIDSIKSKYPNRKLCAFFEPRSATAARNILQKDFIHAFDQADKVFLQKPTKENIAVNEQLEVKEIVEHLKSNQVLAFYSQNEQVLIDQFFKQFDSSSPCVALIMSNGSFSGIHQRIIDNYKLNYSTNKVLEKQ